MAQFCATISKLIATVSLLLFAVEVILAAPGKVPQEEKLYVQKATFGKASTQQAKSATQLAAGTGSWADVAVTAAAVAAATGGPSKAAAQAEGVDGSAWSTVHTPSTAAK